MLAEVLVFIFVSLRRLAAEIRHKLSALQGKRGYADSVLAEVSHEVRQRAEDNFLRVFLVFNDLRVKNGKHAIESIKKYPSGLSELLLVLLILLPR